MILVGSGIFRWPSWNTEANRGTTKFSSTRMEASPTAGQQPGVDHRADNVAAQIVAGAFEFRKLVEDQGERARSLAGAHHVDVQIREVLGVRRETVGERFAAF